MSDCPCSRSVPASLSLSPAVLLDDPHNPLWDLVFVPTDVDILRAVQKKIALQSPDPMKEEKQARNVERSKWRKNGKHLGGKGWR